MDSPSLPNPGRRPRTWSVRILLLIGLIVACAAAYRLGKGTPSAEAATLTVRPEALDFGDVWESQDFRWTLPISNPSRHDVIVEQLEASCDCTLIEPRSFVVPAGQTVEVRLTLDLTRTSREQAGQPIREFEVQVRPRIRGGLLGHEGWKVHGQVRRLFDLEPRILTFWDGVMQGRSGPRKQVLIRGQIPLQLPRVKYDPDILKVDLVATEDPSLFLMEVSPSALLPPGRFSAHLHVEVGITDHSPLSKALKVEGNVQAEIQAVPSQIAWGPKIIGEKVEHPIVIRMKKIEQFEFKGIEGAPPDIEIVPVGMDADAGFQLLLTQTISRPGQQTAQAKMKIRRAEGTVLVVPIELSYFGTGQ